MGRKKKYPNITGWWVYVIKLPNNMYYPGCSQQYPTTRFQPSKYQRTALYSYIEQFGWENLEKIVLNDGFTEEEALKWENCLICMYTKLGCCINKKRSGLISLNKKQYKTQYYKDHKDKYKQYYQEHKEEKGEYQKQYREAHREERREWRKQYYEDHKEEVLEYQKQYYLKKKKNC